MYGRRRIGKTALITKFGIDVVAYDSTGNDIIFGECKYTEKKMDIDIFYALNEKAKQVTWKNDNRKEWYVLFSINGFTDKMMELANGRNDILLYC